MNLLKKGILKCLKTSLLQKARHIRGSKQVEPNFGQKWEEFLSKHTGKNIHLYLSYYNSFNSLLRQARHMRGTNKLSLTSRKNLTHKWEGKF